MGALRKLPIGVQDFEKLRKDGCVYVDKTELIYKLISTGCYYFLSRPRRFGKSLLISTIKGQQIVRIGINFDSKTSNIEKALVG